MNSIGIDCEEIIAKYTHNLLMKDINSQIEKMPIINNECNDCGFIYTIGRERKCRSCRLHCCELGFGEIERDSFFSRTLRNF